MKIQIDGLDLFEIDAAKQKLIEYYLPKEAFQAEIGRRLRWVIDELLNSSYAFLKAEWDPKLEADEAVVSIPSKRDAYVSYVAARPDYKDRSAKEAEIAARS